MHHTIPSWLGEFLVLVPSHHHLQQPVSSSSPSSVSTTIRPKTGIHSMCVCHNISCECESALAIPLILLRHTSEQQTITVIPSSSTTSWRVCVAVVLESRVLCDKFCAVCIIGPGLQPTAFIERSRREIKPCPGIGHRAQG